MRRGMLLAEARRLIVNRNKGSSTAFQRFKCSYVASECQDRVQGLEEKMGSLCTDVQGLCAEVSAMHKGASAWWSNVDKHFLQDPFKKKLASLQEEMKGLRADTTASLCDTCANLDSHVASIKILFSSLQDTMSKGHTELCTRLDAQTELMGADLTEMRELTYDVANTVGLSIQIRNKMDSMHEEMAELRVDVANINCHTQAVDVNLIKEIDILQSFRRVVVDSLKRLQEDTTGLRADVAKVVCHGDADVASSVVILNKKIDLLQENMTRLGADMSKMGIMDRLQEEITGLRAEIPSTHDCSLKIDNILRELQGLHAHILCADRDANMGKVQMDLLNKMHGEMEQLCGVVATMNGNANVVWSNVIAQEKGILKMHELMYALMSDVESYRTDKERANVVLVKIVSAFLACTIAFYAWIVWSFNSCYPF